MRWPWLREAGMCNISVWVTQSVTINLAVNAVSTAWWISVFKRDGTIWCSTLFVTNLSRGFPGVRLQILITIFDILMEKSTPVANERALLLSHFGGKEYTGCPQDECVVAESQRWVIASLSLTQNCGVICNSRVGFSNDRACWIRSRNYVDNGTKPYGSGKVSTFSLSLRLVFLNDVSTSR